MENWSKLSKNYQQILNTNSDNIIIMSLSPPPLAVEGHLIFSAQILLALALAQGWALQSDSQFLCSQYLLNSLVDFYQISSDIYHKGNL